MGTSVTYNSTHCPPPPPPNEKWNINASDSNSDSVEDTVAVDTGDYTVTADSNGTVKIFDDSGNDVTSQCQVEVSGDPHVYDESSHVADTHGTTTVVCPDGTKVTMQTTPAGNGTTFVESVLVSDGNNAVVMNGVAPGGEAISYEATSTQGQDWDESWGDGLTMYLGTDGELYTPQGDQMSQQYVNGFEDGTPYDESQGSQAEIGGSGEDSFVDDISLQIIEEETGSLKKKGKAGSSSGSGIWGVIAAMGEKVDAQLKNVMDAIDKVDTSAENNVTAKQLAEVQVQTAKLGWFGQTWQTVGQTAAQTGEKAGSAGKPS
jgi:hypothetical protein